MTNRGDSTFREVFLQSENQRGLCVVMLLAWLATSDGEVDGAERDILEDIARNGHNTRELTLAIEHAQAGQVEDLQLACEVCRGLSAEQRRLFMQMAVGIVIADGYLTLSENHILRFLADLLGLTPRNLDELFEEAAQEAMPSPGDPGQLAWWIDREADDANGPPAVPGTPAANGAAALTAASTAPVGEPGVAHGMSREAALHQLGLREDATADQMQAAYERLSRIHDPARFIDLGPEAVMASTATFHRVEQAYRTLTQA